VTVRLARRRHGSALATASTGTRRQGRRTWRPARLIGPLALLAIWQACSSAGLISESTLPAPSDVFAAGWTLAKSGDLESNLAASVARVGIGLAIGVGVGVVLALATGLSKIAEDLIDPLMHMFRTVPVLALTQLFILWFGIGEQPKIIIIAVGVLFPVYLNTYAGIRGVDQKLVEVGQVAGLNWRQKIQWIVLPGSLPSFLTGLRYSVGVAWLLLVISEQVNATSGIGYMMSNAILTLRTDVIVLGIVLYAVLGLVSDALVRALERWALRWRKGLEAR
jgi:sulfonate transport system permease protein